MPKFKLSKNAAMKVIAYSDDAHHALMNNISVMDNNINSQFKGLQDPAFKRYLDLSDSMQDMLRQISGKMDQISQYCQSIMRWIDKYNEI